MSSFKVACFLPFECDVSFSDIVTLPNYHEEVLVSLTQRALSNLFVSLLTPHHLHTRALATTSLNACLILCAARMSGSRRPARSVATHARVARFDLSSNTSRAIIARTNDLDTEPTLVTALPSPNLLLHRRRRRSSLNSAWLIVWDVPSWSPLRHCQFVRVSALSVI